MSKNIIAQRAALELIDGQVVNLGFGTPTLVANYIPNGVNIILQTENGALNFGPTPVLGKQDSDVANAAAQPVTLLTGASIFELCTSFAIIRGGHVDVTILGALEVDQEGSIANWARPLAPGKFTPGPGGAMDLCGGVPKIIATLLHVDKKGESKVLKKCTLPLTGYRCLDVIVTDKAVFNVTDTGLVLREIIPGLTIDDIKGITEADFTVAPDLCEYRTS